MKEFLIAFVIALIGTSWVQSSGGPPQPMEVGVRDVQEATKRRTYEPSDSTFDNFTMVDGHRDLTYMNNVVNKSPNATTTQSLPHIGAEH